MLVADGIVYLQLQKTGCSHIEKLLQFIFPQVKSMGKHYRAPKDFDLRSRYVLGSVRNPWAWYLSYWSYSALGRGGPFLRTTAPRSIARVLQDERMKNCRGALVRSPQQVLQACYAEAQRQRDLWRSLYDIENADAFRQWLWLILDERHKYDLFQDYGHSPMSRTTGLFSYLYLFLYTREGHRLYDGSVTDLNDIRDLDSQQNITDCVIRTETLVADFLSVIKSLGISLTAEQRHQLRGIERVNPSKRHFSIEHYYDSESIELVRERDAFIVDKYSYQFGD